MAKRKRFTGIRELLTLAPTGDTPDERLGLIRDGVVDCDAQGRVSWTGAASDAPSNPELEVVDLGGAVVLPGLVDAHTHIVFGGDRTADFASRCEGVSYEEVARRGGGIRLTVRETRAASRDQLTALALARLEDLIAHGATTVEIKSGYGLSFEDELKILEVIARLQEVSPARIIPTLLAAHIVPDEFRDDRTAYVNMIVDELVPEVTSRGLAEHIDVFCEVGAFTVDEALRILDAGRDRGLGLKVHGEQLSHTSISSEAARMGALSVDHCEYLSAADIEVMAEHDTAAVLLPGASLFLGDHERAPARALLDAGVRVALSTDCNPGTSPTRHLTLMGTLGCTMLGMAPHESVEALTSHGAHALGLKDGTGTLSVGAPCDLAVSDAQGWRSLSYAFAARPIREVWIAGERVAFRGGPAHAA
ncbi:MAG: imidazolonepropionase [Deltaproteobacteria bacterium]|nr:imidazolonepropionase [Deltaproteobacteria bacterium]